MARVECTGRFQGEGMPRLGRSPIRHHQGMQMTRGVVFLSVVLITMGVRATSDMDIESEWCGGATMAWSHYDAATNRKMLEDAGFEVVDSADEAEAGSTEHHLWLLARRHAWR